jgi:hypothetical protein
MEDTLAQLFDLRAYIAALQSVHEIQEIVQEL